MLEVNTLADWWTKFRAWPDWLDGTERYEDYCLRRIIYPSNN
jgi:hypothetical protein